MGTEIAIPVFGPFVLVCALVFLFVAISGRKRVVTQSSILGLGRSRLALGYLGALVALIPVVVWMTTDLSHAKVARGDVTVAQAAQYWFDWFLTQYFIVAVIVLVLITIVGLPLLALLRRMRIASLAGALASSLLVALIVAGSFGGPYFDTVALFGAVSIGFALAARLPLVWSPVVSGHATDSSRGSDDF